MNKQILILIIGIIQKALQNLQLYQLAEKLYQQSFDKILFTRKQQINYKDKQIEHMIFNNKMLVNPFNERPQPQSHRQVSRSPQTNSGHKETSEKRRLNIVSKTMAVNETVNDQYYTPKIDRSYKKQINSLSISPTSHTTSKKYFKKRQDRYDVGQYLPSLESQQIQKLAENIMDQEQQTIFQSPRKENLYLQRYKLQEEFNIIKDDNIKSKTRVSGLESSVALLSKRLAELKEQKKLEQSSPQTTSNKKLQSPFRRKSITKETCQTSSNKLDEHISHYQDLKSNLKISNEENVYKDEQIQNMKSLLKYTEIEVLEDQRMHYFDKVISLRQNLDKTLLQNKLGQLIIEKNNDGFEKAYNERIDILQQDKKSLIEQYQKLWSYNQSWIRKLEHKQFEKHDLKVVLRKKNNELIKLKTEYQKLLYSRNQRAQSPPEVFSRSRQKLQEENKTKDQKVEYDQLTNQIKEREQSLIVKEEQIQKYEQKSKEELGEVQLINTDLRDKIIELRRQNDGNILKRRIIIIFKFIQQIYIKLQNKSKYYIKLIFYQIILIHIQSLNFIEIKQSLILLNDYLKQNLRTSKRYYYINIQQELFREIRIKTQKIIDTPGYEVVQINNGNQNGVNSDDNVLSQARQIRKLSDLLQADESLEGFEFSSMNKSDLIARLNIYKMEMNQQNNKIQGIINGNNDQLNDNNYYSEKSIEKKDKVVTQPLSSNEIQNKQVQNDNLEDLPIESRKKISLNAIDKIALQNPQNNENRKSESIKQDQEQQYNQKQANILTQKKEEEILKLKEIELLEQQKNILLQKQLEIEKLEELKRQHHEKDIIEKINKQQQDLLKQKSEEEKKLKNMINSQNNADQKNKMNDEMSLNDQLKHQAQNATNDKMNGERKLSQLSSDQWKMIQKHIESSKENGDRNYAEKVISQTLQSITEPNNITEGEQFEFDYHNNPKHYVDSIITKFDYDEEKTKYLNLISQKQFKQFPNQALKDRHLENNVTQIQINFLEDIFNFDFHQFRGNIRQKRTEKSLNNQKYLMSNQIFADSVILKGQWFDFSHYMNSEDLSRTCDEHHTKKNVDGTLNQLLSNGAYTKLFVKNFLIMQNLDKEQFKVGEQLAGFSQDRVFKGLINSTQQQVCILKVDITTKEDFIMYSQDITSITQMNNPFILHPIASFLDKFADSATFYRIYSPFKVSLKDYLQKNLLKMSYENKLTLSLQICMAVFAIHCKNIVIGGQIDLDNIVIQDPDKSVLQIKFIQIFSQVTQSESDVTTYFKSPECQYNRQLLEYRCDVYSIGLLLYKLFTNTDSSDKKVILSDEKVPQQIQKVLGMCLQDNYRDRISSAGLCIYLQYLLQQENPDIVYKSLFQPMQLLDSQDGLFSDSFKILPYESMKNMPTTERGLVYLENGCYYGTLNKNKQFNCEKSYVFQYDSQNKVVQAFVSNFKNGLYQFSFSFNTKLETLNIYQREGNQIWFADTNTQELLLTKNHIGFTVIPDELQANFIDFVMQKKFKLIDDCGNIVIGEYSQNGLYGIGCKLNHKTKSLQIGIYEGNQLNGDGIHYYQSRIYNYMPQKDYKLKDRGMCELSNSLQIGPLKQPKNVPSVFLKYTDNNEVKAKIIRYTLNYRIEYIMMDELVVLCMQNQKSEDPQFERVLAVMDQNLQLHSFLPASNTVQISDMHLQDGYLGLGLSIEKDEVYVGHFTSNVKQIEKNDLLLNKGYFFQVDAAQKVACLQLKQKIQNITLL